MTPSSFSMRLLEIVSPFIFATETDSVLRNVIFVTVYIKLSSKTFDLFYATGLFLYALK